MKPPAGATVPGAAERDPGAGAAPSELTRRALHAAAGVLGPLAAALGPSVATPAFGALVAAAAAAELGRRRRPAFRAALERLAGGAFRPRETSAVSGASLLAAGFALSWWLFPVPAAERAILVAALADPMAAAVGSRLGSGGGKSLAGSAACAVTAALVLLLTGVPAAPTAAAALVAALAERAPWPGADNVAIPLGVGATLWWLG
ncbi:MAG TPA: hypothetical protein VEH62_03035 [Gemmatimonadales bacterium]|nr:hypothetical protein [Gemmatimonadales bacterium]